MVRSFFYKTIIFLSSITSSGKMLKCFKKVKTKSSSVRYSCSIFHEMVPSGQAKAVSKIPVSPIMRGEFIFSI
jgi:hypothetical protein